MHNSSAMPFVHFALVAVVVLAFVALVVVKKLEKRKRRAQAPEETTDAEAKHG